MATMTIRNIPDEIHRAIKMRAALNGRSAEAEVRMLLQQAASDEPGAGFGDELAALGEALGSIELDVQRSEKPMRVARFDP